MKKLQEKGFRITAQRKTIFEELTEFPLTAQEIYKRLQKKQVSVDLVSVYRTLELFDKMGIVHWTQIDGETKRYEIISTSRHHHHVTCKRCGTIQDILLEEQTLIDRVNKKTKFKIDHHHLEFFGLCPECQKKN